jgi:uncharacterized protein (PEP-CTERM system associated)
MTTPGSMARAPKRAGALRSRCGLRAMMPLTALPLAALLGMTPLYAQTQAPESAPSPGQGQGQGQGQAQAPAPTAGQGRGAFAGPPNPRRLQVLTDITVTQTLTDNANLSSTDKRADLITSVTPSVHLRSGAGRVQGFFDYSLSGLLYANGSQSNTIQQALNAGVKAEAIENFAFIDASANVSRQNISALGTQSTDSSLRTSNQTEVRSFSVAPYVRGRLGSLAGYQLRLNYSTSRTNASEIGNSTNSGGSLHLGSDGAFARLNWALDASRQVTDFSVGRKTEVDSAIGSLIFSPVYDLQLFARAGREINNVVSFERQGSATYGGGLRWLPSPRTSLSAQYDRRYFGNSHSVTFEHRTASTAWTLSSSRGAGSDASAAGRTPQLTEFDLLYLQLASAFPDPLERARQVLIRLQALGKNPLAPAQGGFLSNAVSVQRTYAASFAYLGLRTTVLLLAQQSDSSRLDALSTAVDSLAGNNSVRQRLVGLTVAHRLTPLATGNLSLTQSRSTDIISGSRVDLLSLTAGGAIDLGVRTRTSFGVRHSISDGDASTYTESAVFASFTYQF